MYLAYLQERYGDNLSVDWDSYLQENEMEYYKTPYGFVTYKLEGDSLQIFDMYVKPEYRGHTYSGQLINYLTKKALLESKRVIITFSDVAGKDHMKGIKTMKFYGFVPAATTNERFVFIKGI